MRAFRSPDPAEEGNSRAKAGEFVQYAQAGDVDKMLQITSPLSHATQTDSMRKLYAEQVVPAFRETTVTWQAGSTRDFDETDNVGYLFTGVAHGKTTFSFDVVVMKESGVLYIINIRKHHWYNNNYHWYN